MLQWTKSVDLLWYNEVSLQAHQTGLLCYNEVSIQSHQAGLLCCIEVSLEASFAAVKQVYKPHAAMK